jgi:hypothetical protein
VPCRFQAYKPELLSSICAGLIGEDGGTADPDLGRVLTSVLPDRRADDLGRLLALIGETFPRPLGTTLR